MNKWNPASLRLRRQGAGLTQAQLAVRIKVDASMVSYLESGKRVPSLAVMQRIARALRCDVADLFRKASVS
jgi:putative transcriptional regulator